MNSTFPILVAAALAACPPCLRAQGRTDTLAPRALQPAVVNIQVPTPPIHDPCGDDSVLAAIGDSLQRLDAARELRETLARGDSSFLGFCGSWGCHPEGLDDYDSTVAAAVQTYRMRSIRCFYSGGRIVITPARTKAWREARVFAWRYNRLLVQGLQLTFSPSSLLPLGR